MKVLLGILVVALALATLDSGCASALSCAHSTFEEQVGWAKIIFVGTVTSDTCTWIPCSPGGKDSCSIVTKYQFGHVTYLKGHGPADSLILVQMGGTVGNDQIIVSGEVEFELGSRYVVLAGRSRTSDYHSANPCGVGPFGIWSDSSLAAAGVHLGRNPLIAFDGTHLVGLHSRPWSPESGIWEKDERGARRPPSRLPLSELMQASDEYLRSRMEREGQTQERIDEVLAQVRTIWLFPHQDPGDRVTEDEFLDALVAVIRRVEEAPKVK